MVTTSVVPTELRANAVGMTDIVTRGFNLGIEGTV